MREHKYRGWCNWKKRMYYSEPFAILAAERMWHTEEGNLLYPDHEGRRPEEYLEIMEYSGINDKTDIKKVYEDDIIKGKVLKPDLTYQTITNKVRFEKGIFLVGMVPLRIVKDIEILGNIHENPELLEESE